MTLLVILIILFLFFGAATERIRIAATAFPAPASSSSSSSSCYFCTRSCSKRKAIMLDFKSILSTLRAAVDAKLTGEATKLAPLNTEAIGFVEKTVAPHLDISPNIVAIASTQNATIEKAVEPLEIAGLQFLQARIDALL